MCGAKLILAVLVTALLCGAQPLTTPVNVIPDCAIYFDFTDNASSASFDNRFIGCKTWYVAYTSTGFPAITLTVESSADNNGAPAAWGAFGGAVIEGVNPNVAITQASTILYGYFPWNRVTLSGAVAGAGRRLRGTFYGYRQTPVATVILPPAVTVTADQGAPNTDANRWPVYLSDGAAAQGSIANPLVIGNSLYDGAAAAWTPMPACTERAAITIAGAGTTEIVALAAGDSIRVCHVSVLMSGATNLTIVEGTGAACAVGTTGISGPYTNSLGFALDFGDRSLVTGTAGNALCITNSAAVTGGGFVTYARY